jgi:hypothetical protein
MIQNQNSPLNILHSIDVSTTKEWSIPIDLERTFAGKGKGRKLGTLSWSDVCGYGSI